MKSISVTKARENIYQIFTDVNTNNRDKNAIQETLYLNSIPGVAESIVAGGNTPLEECMTEDEVER